MENNIEVIEKEPESLDSEQIIKIIKSLTDIKNDIVNENTFCFEDCKKRPLERFEFWQQFSTERAGLNPPRNTLDAFDLALFTQTTREKRKSQFEEIERGILDVYDWLESMIFNIKDSLITNKKLLEIEQGLIQDQLLDFDGLLGVQEEAKESNLLIEVKNLFEEDENYEQ